MFAIARSETGNGLDACNGCELLPTKGDESRQIDDEEIEGIVSEIESIFDWQAAGIATDWDCYPFEYQILLTVLTAARREYKEYSDARMFAEARKQSLILAAGLGVKIGES